MFDTGTAPVGSEIECPTCRSALRVPGPVPGSEPAPRPRAPVRRCMACGAGIPLGRRACPTCGKGYRDGIAGREQQLEERAGTWRRGGALHMGWRGATAVPLGISMMVLATDARMVALGAFVLLVGIVFIAWSVKRYRDLLKGPHGRRSDTSD